MDSDSPRDVTDLHGERSAPERHLEMALGLYETLGRLTTEQNTIRNAELKPVVDQLNDFRTILNNENLNNEDRKFYTIELKKLRRQRDAILDRIDDLQRRIDGVRETIAEYRQAHPNIYEQRSLTWPAIHRLLNLCEAYINSTQ